MKHYLIDSENVGDFWIPLLTLPEEDTNLIVFFTKNSPHMSYDSLIKLKESDRKVVFIKCYEGTNALDFQLCSELGFLISRNESDDFIIVTSDAGYDAAVKYWRHKGYSVKRIAGKDSRPAQARRRGPARIDVLAEVNAAAAVANSSEIGVIHADQTDVSSENAAIFGNELNGEPDEGSEIKENEETPAFSDHVSGNDTNVPAENELEAAPDENSVSEYEDSMDEFSESESKAEEESILDVSDEKISEIVDEVIAETVFEEDDELPLNNETANEPISIEQAKTAAETEPVTAEDDAAAREEEITAIVNCVGLENLAELHNQLIQFYGEKGKEIYISIKNGNKMIKSQNWDRQEKFLYYSALIFRHNDEFASTVSEETVREFSEFLLANERKRQNLNALRYALIKHYGKEIGQKYYFMLKPYVKAMNQM